MLDGETVTFEGRYFRARGARLSDRPERRVPVYMSAFGPKTAAIEGQRGVITTLQENPTQRTRMLGGLGWPLPPHASLPRASSQGQQDVASCPS
jgi:coenzyme F420-dependent glucose-6-phosphate dehydrogenase